MGNDLKQENKTRDLVVAPYNFSRFCEQALVRYSDIEELPPHNTMDASLKSGEIVVKMIAETPVMITGKTTEMIRDGKKETHKYFFQDAEGNYVIPGSTLKGLVRENMQILSFGFVRPGEDIYDERLFFRNVAGKSSDLKDFYKDVLKISNPTIGINKMTGKPIKTSDPQNVCSGYLVCEGRDQYSIYPVPVQDGNKGKCYILSRTRAGIKNLPELEKLALKPRGKGNPEFDRINNEHSAKIIPVCYKAENGRVTDIKLNRQNLPGMKNGKLLVAGIPVGKDNAVYLFPEFIREGNPIRLTDSDLIAYKDDLAARKIGMPTDIKGNPKTLWDLPETLGEYKPVFYLRDGSNRIYFGMTRFLRIGYPYTIADGLPEIHKTNDKEEKKTGKRTLDYPSAVLGFAVDKQAYKSRVSFENLTLIGKTQIGSLPPLVLASPKPSFSAGYLENNAYYIDPVFRLRGYKHYWFQKQPGGKNSDKENVAAILHPLAKGSSFEGKIRFKNLTEDELGLLLWSLLPKETGADYYHSVGGAKPYGYGRMKLIIDRVTEYNTSDLYKASSLCSGGTDCTSRIGHYLDAYRKYAASLMKTNKLRYQDDPLNFYEVLDFLYIKSLITDNQDEVRYMSLDDSEYQNNIGTLYTVEDYYSNRMLEGETKP